MSDTGAGPPVAAYGPASDVRVARAAMLQHWDDLTFVHWRYDAAAVARLLPAGLEVETFDGSAWVGLVPFLLRVGLPRGRPVSLSRFPETNVRTYVVNARGERGVWFFSLDATRLDAVVAARSVYRLPYFWSSMSISRAGSTITYEARRRAPGPGHPRSIVEIETGEPLAPGELGDLDHFLTARWRLFSASRGGLRGGEVVHDPWPLARARVVRIEDELVPAAGLPAPSGEAVVHFAPSVSVRIGWPRRVGG